MIQKETKKGPHETWHLTVAPIRDGYSYGKTLAENPTLQFGCTADSCIAKTEIKSRFNISPIIFILVTQEK